MGCTQFDVILRNTTLSKQLQIDAVCLNLRQTWVETFVPSLETPFGSNRAK